MRIAVHMRRPQTRARIKTKSLDQNLASRSRIPSMSEKRDKAADAIRWREVVGMGRRKKRIRE